MNATPFIVYVPSYSVSGARDLEKEENCCYLWVGTIATYPLDRDDEERLYME